MARLGSTRRRRSAAALASVYVTIPPKEVRNEMRGGLGRRLRVHETAGVAEERGRAWPDQLEPAVDSLLKRVGEAVRNV